jgi:transcriptional regulator with XRE-family HTH domain
MRKHRLREVMERSGHNPASLAELIGSSERNIWRLLNEDAHTSDETVMAIAMNLEVSTDYLLGLTDDPTPYVRIDNLSDTEKQVLAALRSGKKLKAIAIIAAD